MAHLKLSELVKKFGANVALDGLSLDIADGEFFVLLGPTGAGKTTALRAIAGLEKMDQGAIEIGNQNVDGWSAAERDVALVFQYYSLYPRYSVYENLAFPLRARIRKFSEAEIKTRISKAAKTLRIEHLLERKTDRLSGGEMQRVSIGRAIVREPRAFLMDEPLSNLDAKLREALRSELKDLQMKLGATFLFVTHDQVEAMSMGDRVGVMKEGRIVQVGTPYEIYNNPNSVFVASFVGSPAINFLPVEWADGKAQLLNASIGLDLGSKGPKRSVTLGVRSEDVILDAKQPFAAKIHDVENHGVEKIVTLRSGKQLLRATVKSATPTSFESEVKFGFNPNKVHCFDSESGQRLASKANVL